MHVLHMILFGLRHKLVLNLRISICSIDLFVYYRSLQYTYGSLGGRCSFDNRIGTWPIIVNPNSLRVCALTMSTLNAAGRMNVV